MDGIGVRLQIAVIFIYMVLVMDYVRNKKLAVVASKWFSVLMGLAGVNMTLELLTVYLTEHLEEASEWGSRFIHQLYTGSLDLLILAIFIYATMLVEQGPFSVKKWLPRLVPAFLVLVMVMSGSVHFEHRGEVNYAVGPMTWTPYIMTVVYLIPILVKSFQERNERIAEYQMGIRIGTIVWCFIMLLQFAFPNLKLVSLAITMTLFIIYLSFGNPKAFKDDSTEAFNRKAFGLVIDGLLGEGKCFGIVSITFENHARTNTRFGYEVGDRILRTIIERMYAVSGPRIYRISADTVSFVLYTPALSPKKKNFILEILNKEFMIGKDRIITKLHVDVIEYAEKLGSRDEIFDMIHYMAGQEIHENDSLELRMYDDSILRARKRDSQIEEVLLEAIKNDGFEMFYQPILSTEKGRFASAEALIRLKSTRELGNISPEEYIPIAEKKGLINEIGRIVVDKVCGFIRSAKLLDRGVDYIEVNLSGIQCVNLKLPQQLKAIMEKYVLPPKCINLEITETAVVESGELLLQNMRELRKAGFHFSMDDFGTGYSNLAQMTEFGYELVKLDKSLLWSCFKGEQQDKALVVLENVTKMIHSLGSHIVAEGVETKEQARLLGKLGVEYHQGYLYSKPVNEVQYIQFLDRVQPGGVGKTLDAIHRTEA